MIEPHSKKRMKKYVVIEDTHAPFQDRRAVNCVLQYIPDYKPDAIVHLGDVGDWQSVSHWLKNKQRKLEGLRLIKDMNAATELLELFKDIPEKIVCLGNHEDWVEQYVDENATLDGIEQIDVTARFKGIGWRVIPMNVPFKVGKLLMFHGISTCEHHAKATVHAFSKSCIYGHTHTAQLHTESFYDGEKSAQSIGCLCDMNPDYMKNKQKKWVHGFATVESDTVSGDFFIDFIKIVNGRFSRNGKIYDGK